MTELIIACIRTGARVPFDRVTTLRNAVDRNLDRPYTMVCLTDQPERCTGVAFVDISAMKLTGWWTKMALFEPQWRAGAKVVYLAFDAAVSGDIASLADVPGEFAICHSEVSDCGYNPSVMVLGSLMGNFVWYGFERRRDLMIIDHARFGPATCIEELYPSAPSLQRLLSPEFFRTNLRLM
ncbi:hypothetical protein [Bradyrhizobium sp. S3.9.1]|uniref:hypothetical protein n=1 Tax=Bradyrhizobium sp. S3.9.1 TaxID=3156431 RepID=UPI003395A343